MSYTENPKMVGSGMLACIPQKGRCPNNCDDCFFQGGRGFLEPLDENTPNIPTPEMAKGRVVRMNDGNDSNYQRTLVEEVAARYDDAFFNTSSPDRLGEFPRPVVLTVNPGKMTDTDFHKVDPIPPNLMFVRVRVNAWNLDLVDDVVSYYATQHDVPVVLTFMAYYETPIKQGYEQYYEWQTRTINSYWCIKDEARRSIEERYIDYSRVYTCGYKDTHACMYCGNCLREYSATKERMRND